MADRNCTPNTLPTNTGKTALYDAAELLEFLDTLIETVEEDPHVAKVGLQMFRGELAAA